ncbi:MAG: DUF3795 domain-containing protein [Sphaerochaetaceae bacterium]|jgi:hypothetical protein|nr:DUF3795 domain-containing protein [Sphaerochaetaceae bacterium]
MSADYPYGYCGMPCALCSRYNTQGTSRCPGCSHDGYYTEPCKVHHCCKSKGLVQCGKCPDYPCLRLGSMSDFSDLDTNHVKLRTSEAIKERGWDAWYEDYCTKADLLKEALERYNDGRMKRWLCELFIKGDLESLKALIEKARNLDGDLKQRAKAFRALSEQ